MKQKTNTQMGISLCPMGIRDSKLATLIFYKMLDIYQKALINKTKVKGLTFIKTKIGQTFHVKRIQKIL